MKALLFFGFLGRIVGFSKAGLKFFRKSATVLSAKRNINAVFDNTGNYFDKSNMKFVNNVNTDNVLYKLDKWGEYIENEPTVYPESTKNAITSAVSYIKYPALIVKNDTQTLYIIEWQHSVKARKKDLSINTYVTPEKKTRRIITSHIIFAIQDEKALNVYGIVENPENAIHEFSIHYMIYVLKNKLKKEKTKLNTHNLKYWCFGIYYYSLKNKLKGEDGIPAIDDNNTSKKILDI